MPFAFAMAFGLSACSDDSSSGTNANTDSGNEINNPVSDKETSDDSFVNEDWREDCLAKINEYRATESRLAPTSSPLTILRRTKLTAILAIAANSLRTVAPISVVAGRRMPLPLPNTTSR